MQGILNWTLNDKTRPLMSVNSYNKISSNRLGNVFSLKVCFKMVYFHDIDLFGMLKSVCHVIFVFYVLKSMVS